jgi:hypothetical protein
MQALVTFLSESLLLGKFKVDVEAIERSPLEYQHTLMTYLESEGLTPDPLEAVKALLEAVTLNAAAIVALNAAVTKRENPLRDEWVKHGDRMETRMDALGKMLDPNVKIIGTETLPGGVLTLSPEVAKTIATFIGEEGLSQEHPLGPIWFETPDNNGMIMSKHVRDEDNLLLSDEVRKAARQRTAPIRTREDERAHNEMVESRSATPELIQLTPLQKLMGADFKAVNASAQARIQRLLDDTPIYEGVSMERTGVDWSLKSSVRFPFTDREAITESIKPIDRSALVKRQPLGIPIPEEAIRAIFDSPLVAWESIENVPGVKGLLLTYTQEEIQKAATWMRNEAGPVSKAGFSKFLSQVLQVNCPKMSPGPFGLMTSVRDIDAEIFGRPIAASYLPLSDVEEQKVTGCDQDFPGETHGIEIVISSKAIQDRLVGPWDGEGWDEGMDEETRRQRIDLARKM